MRMIYRFALLFSLILTAYPTIAKEAPITFAPVAKKLVQSVVNISSTQKIVTPNIEYKGSSPFPFDLKGLPQGSLLEEFLNEFFWGIPPEALSPFNNSNPKRKAMSLGSGFIISEDGIIVTNNHVIDNAEQITITFFDNTEASAKILGRDEKTDIAILKVDKTNLTPVTFGDSDKTEIGDWVLAVGNPFGLGNTVTSGIISAKSRNIDAGPYDDFFQTDAAINRGNSGGPLCNIDGEVIGINTAIFSPSGGNVGIGFAIPANMAKWVIDQIIKEGKVHRAWIGVVIQDLSPDIAESLGLKDVKGGGLITDLSPDSPAQKAGLEIGDIITEFDGKKIENVKMLPILVAETKIGKQVNLKILRNGEEKNIPIKLTEMQDEKNITADNKNASKNDANIDKESAILSSLGLKIKPINENTIKQYNLPKNSKGVVISSVDADSDAAEKGVSVGNVITSINKTPVNSVEEALSALRKGEDLGRENVLILIETNQGKRFIALKVKKN